MKRWNELLQYPRYRRFAVLPLEQARLDIRALFSEAAENLPAEVQILLPEFSSLREFRTSQHLIDDLDKLYFDLEDAGQEAGSQHAFSAARFASACLLFSRAESRDELMNAVYELHHARLSSDG